MQDAVPETCAQSSPALRFHHPLPRSTCPNGLGTRWFRHRSTRPGICRLYQSSSGPARHWQRSFHFPCAVNPINGCRATKTGFAHRQCPKVHALPSNQSAYPQRACRRPWRQSRGASIGRNPELSTDAFDGGATENVNTLVSGAAFGGTQRTQTGEPPWRRAQRLGQQPPTYLGLLRRGHMRRGRSWLLEKMPGIPMSRSLVRVLLQATLQQPLDAQRNLIPDRGRSFSTATRVSATSSPSNARRPVSIFVKHTAECPDVRALVDCFATGLLGAHVRSMTQEHTNAGHHRG